MFEMIQSILLHATHKGSTYFTNGAQKEILFGTRILPKSEVYYKQ